MRRRIQALFSASLLAAALFFVNGVAIPQVVLACSCMPPEPIAAAAEDPRRAIVLATIGFPLGEGPAWSTSTAVAIEGRFTGTIEAEVIPVRNILLDDGTCGLGASEGERWLLVLFRDDDGIYSTNSCLPSGQIGTEHGDALLDEAIAAFGNPSVPATPEPEPPAPIDFSPWLGGLGWVIAVVGAGAVLLGLVALVARRRPGD